MTNNLQMLLSSVIHLCRNFAVRISKWYVSGRKWKNFWHSSTTAADPVRNNFINERVTVNSSDRFIMHKQSNYAFTAQFYAVPVPHQKTLSANNYYFCNVFGFGRSDFRNILPLQWEMISVRIWSLKKLPPHPKMSWSNTLLAVQGSTFRTPVSWLTVRKLSPE